jgi:hypothetical protein
MKKQLEVDLIYDLIKVLNDEGYSIIEIDEEYFSTTEFTPSDKNTPYHTVIGRHITKIILDHLNIGLSDNLGVTQKIDILPERELKFSNHYKYKWMIR